MARIVSSALGRMALVVFSASAAVIPGALLTVFLIFEVMARDSVLYESGPVWQYQTKPIAALLLSVAGYAADVTVLWVCLPRMWPRATISFARRAWTSLLAAALFTAGWFIAGFAYFFVGIARS